MEQRLALVSFFSGSGGLDLGFEQAGFETVVGYDIFRAAIETYNFNRHRAIARYGDVRTLTGVSVAKYIKSTHGSVIPVGIIGGPPCQAFSRSNVYPKPDDIRRTLPGHFARLISELNSYYENRIAFFVFENVHGITFERHKSEFARFRFLFEEAGFHLHERLMNAKNYGVAQDRPRVFIVGLNKSLFSENEDPIFPAPENVEVTVRAAFEQAFGPEPWPDPAFYKRGISPSQIPFHPNHWTLMPKSPKFHNGLLKEGEIKGRSFRVLSWSKPSWTVAYGHREIHVHPSGTRRLSIFEAMALQGYPKDYVLRGTLSDQITQVSDAVPPPLARKIALALFERLRQKQIVDDKILEP